MNPFTSASPTQPNDANPSRAAGRRLGLLSTAVAGPIAAAVGLILACALWQGRLSERWSQHDTTARQLEFAECLKKIPTRFGDWDSKPSEVDPKQLKHAQVVGHFERKYFNRRRPSEEVSVFIVCGEPYHITDHSPDQCYVCQGYAMSDEPQRYTLNSGEFFHAKFLKDNVKGGAQNLLIFWSWASDPHWEAPTIPRIHFVKRDALYKLYAISETSGQSAPVDQSVNVRFLKQFVGELDKVLFPAASPQGEPKELASAAR